MTIQEKLSLTGEEEGTEETGEESLLLDFDEEEETEGEEVE